MKQHCRQTAGAGLLAGLCVFLYLTTGLCAACRAVTDAAAALDKTPWVSVNAKANVVFGAKAWTGASDLAFKYRYRLDPALNVMHLQVDVTDDKVVLKDADTVASDHVELWLADDALADIAALNLDRVRDYDPAQATQHLGDGEAAEVTGCDEFRASLQDIKNIAESLKKDKHHVQIIFNRDRLMMLPNPRGADKITWDYKTRAGGYLFTASIPVAGLLDAQGEAIADLALLVDVSDIDTQAAAKQDSLMSSSEHRRFDDPASFMRVQLDTPMPLPLTPYQRMLGALAPDGFYRADTGAPGGYTRRAWTDYFLFDCHYWILDELPGAPEPIAVQQLKPLAGYQGSEAQFYSYENRLGVLLPDASGVADLGDAAGGTGAFETTLLHRLDVYSEGAGMRFNGAFLLLKVMGASRFPMGNGMCGAGFETDVILVGLDKDMNVMRMDPVRIESCYQNITMNDIKLRVSDGSDMQGDVEISFEEFRYDAETDQGLTLRRKIVYTAAQPEPRFEIVDVPAPEDE